MTRGIGLSAIGLSAICLSTIDSGEVLVSREVKWLGTGIVKNI